MPYLLNGRETLTSADDGSLFLRQNNEPAAARAGVLQRSLWVEQTTLTLAQSLPGISRWFEVEKQELVEMSPLENDSEVFENKMLQLRTLIAQCQMRQMLNINLLTMCLNGVIDAAVNGGLARYQEVWDWIESRINLLLPSPSTSISHNANSSAPFSSRASPLPSDKHKHSRENAFLSLRNRLCSGIFSKPAGPPHSYISGISSLSRCIVSETCGIDLLLPDPPLPPTVPTDVLIHQGSKTPPSTAGPASHFNCFVLSGMVKSGKALGPGSSERGVVLNGATYSTYIKTLGNGADGLWAKILQSFC
ncbi:hypothetical protein QQF64_022959 [Cirrhinus molitorella]|uniref:DOCKER domain-containing protein n=1 Tax=Cirrhinus molitorella TaxID=172907 RepID=A0ABR3L406_9TELE